MKHTLICLILLMGGLFALSACGESPTATPTPAISATIDNLKDPQFNDKRVSVTGYVFLSMYTSCSGSGNTKSCGIELHSAPNGKGASVTAYILVGNTPNHMEDLPDKYSQADLKLHTTKGETLDPSVPVTLTGMHPAPITAGNSTSNYLNNVDTIERASGPVPTAADTRPAPVTATFDSITTMADKTRVSITGYVSIGMMSSCNNYSGVTTCDLEFHKDANGSGDSILLNVEEGNDKNQMAALPDKYSEKDLKIRGDDGQIISSGAKVTITGTYTKANTTRIIDVETITAAT